jgi:Na+/H+ antiporter NhaC
LILAILIIIDNVPANFEPFIEITMHIIVNESKHNMPSISDIMIDIIDDHMPAMLILTK